MYFVPLDGDKIMRVVGKVGMFLIGKVGVCAIEVSPEFVEFLGFKVGFLSHLSKQVVGFFILGKGAS